MPATVAQHRAQPRSTAVSAGHARIERLGCTFAHQGAGKAIAREQVEAWFKAVRMAVCDRGPLPSPGARIQWRACANKLDAALIAREPLTRQCVG